MARRVVHSFIALAACLLMGSECCAQAVYSQTAHGGVDAEGSADPLTVCSDCHTEHGTDGTGADLPAAPTIDQALVFP